MFKDQLKKIGKKQENEPAEKRKIENLVFFVLLLIITIVIMNVIWKGNKSNSNKSTTNIAGKQLASQKEELGQPRTSNEMEQKLEDILTKIQGVRTSKGFYPLFGIK